MLSPEFPHLRNPIRYPTPTSRTASAWRAEHDAVGMHWSR